MERGGPSRGGGSGALRPCFVCLAFRGLLACPGAEVSRLLERPPVRLGVRPTGSQETDLFPRCHRPKGTWRPLAPRSPWLRQSGGGYRRLLAWPQLLAPLTATLVLERGGKTSPRPPHPPSAYAVSEAAPAGPCRVPHLELSRPSGLLFPSWVNVPHQGRVSLGMGEGLK